MEKIGSKSIYNAISYMLSGALKTDREFPRGSVVKTPRFCCRGHRFNWGTKISPTKIKTDRNQNRLNLWMIFIFCLCFSVSQTFEITFYRKMLI